MSGAVLATFVVLLGSLGLALASTPSSYSWVYTYPTGFASTRYGVPLVADSADMLY